MPTQPGSFVGKKLVAVKLRTLNFGDELPDGTQARLDTKCPTVSEVFGKLPDVDQYQTSIGNGKEVVAHDCCIVAEATITAGKLASKDCTASSSAGAQELYATCFTSHGKHDVEEDLLSNLALDFTSEVLKYTVLQNYSQPWMNDDLTEYTTGMLLLGYHAAWSGLMRSLGNASEPVTIRPAEGVVFANIDRGNLYIWLALNAMLTISALLVFLVQRLGKTKTIRDPTVAALTVDLTEITCRGAGGLCNAVTLSKEDKKLPELVWKHDRNETEIGDSSVDGSCRRRVVFANMASSRVM
ncbi:hypothetical protein K505DRAFT_331482 [Melanomma pulvis-pyrius CBS 109.77]|uniref:Uncharacterized protein n=1 Tax=Melanomma pulvis-pyrius CBS 109.77 TaxID=1314802 RepID=A0A6A6XWE2_9PLEO|nr:hypothetical protein K505DRAFT_331482 [Melanomma pulvis-pyrius CBS 109.77]